MTTTNNGANNGQSATQTASPQGGAPAAAAAASGTNGQVQAVSAEPPENNTSAGGSSYRPEGIPDHMVGATDQETIDKLFKAVDGFRKTRGESGIPDTPEGYTFEFPEDEQSKIFRFDQDGKDPVLEAFRPLFHELGVSQKGAQALVSKLAEVAAGLPLASEGESGDDADFAFAQYGGPEKARPVIDGVMAWASALKGPAKLDDGDLAEVAVMTSYGKGLSVLSKMRLASGQEPIPVDISGDAVKDDGLTQAQLNEMVADPRYHDPRKRDPEFVKKVTEGFQKLYASA